MGRYLKRIVEADDLDFARWHEHRPVVRGYREKDRENERERHKGGG